MYQPELRTHKNQLIYAWLDKLVFFIAIGTFQYE